ncbi:MAG: hypothetical protein U1E76_04310 [Planctomycetota bacterium]
MTHRALGCAWIGMMLLAALALAPLGAMAQKGGKDTELEKHMEAMDDHFKVLKKDVKDAAKNASSLEHVIEMQKQAIHCKLEKPKMTATLPEAERAKFALEFRKQLIVLEHKLRDLEMALLDNDNARAADVYKELEKIQDAGHEKFTNE